MTTQYYLDYTLETGQEVSEEINASSQDEAFELATLKVMGGEGILSCITLSNEYNSWEYSFYEWV